MIYLASKLTEPQAVSKDELFYNHAQLSAILEAKEITPGRKLHKVIEQTGDIFQAIGGICQRDAQAGAALLKEFGSDKEEAGVLHAQLCALATEMAFLLHAKNITTENVLGLLRIPLLPGGRTYQYVAGDNTRTKWEPSIARINQHEATASYEHRLVAARRGMAVDNRTSSRDRTGVSQWSYDNGSVQDEETSSTISATSVRTASENSGVSELTATGLLRIRDQV